MTLRTRITLPRSTGGRAIGALGRGAAHATRARIARFGRLGALRGGSALVLRRLPVPLATHVNRVALHLSVRPERTVHQRESIRHTRELQRSSPERTTQRNREPRPSARTPMARMVQGPQRLHTRLISRVVERTGSALLQPRSNPGVLRVASGAGAGTATSNPASREVATTARPDPSPSGPRSIRRLDCEIVRRIGSRGLQIEDAHVARGVRRVLERAHSAPPRSADGVSSGELPSATDDGWGRRSAPAAAPVRPPALDVEALTADVMRRIDRRMTAWRERTGRL